MGYFLDRAELNNALVERARRAGVTLAAGAPVVNLRIHENNVELYFKGERRERGRVACCSRRGGSRTSRRWQGSRGWGARASSPDRWMPDADNDLRAASVHLVLGLDQNRSFCWCCLGRAQTFDQPALGRRTRGTRRRSSRRCVSGCTRPGSCPLDLSNAARGAAFHASPASLALDLDTHIAKHTLLVGEAGGFVAAGQQRRALPRDVVRSVGWRRWSRPPSTGKRSQDKLMTFEQRWRTTMADYLRPPNTDMQFLLPLVFSNQPMADRLAAAFFPRGRTSSRSFASCLPPLVRRAGQAAGCTP